jgi:hypothetical protein
LQRQQAVASPKIRRPHQSSLSEDDPPMEQLEI